MRKLLCIVCGLFFAAIAAKAVSHVDNYQRWQRLPSKELMRMGMDYAERRAMPDSALVCFTIVSNRQAKSLADEERQYVVGSYNGKWFVYFFSYFDYAKSLESLMRAEELCDEYGMNKARVYLNFGCMYQTLSEQSKDEELDQKAFDYYRMSIQEARKVENYDIIYNAMGNLIYVADALHRLDDIREDYAYVENLKGQSDHDTYQYVYDLYDGMTAMNSHDYQRADSAFTRQLRIINNKHSSIRYKYLTYINIARLRSQQGQLQQAVSNVQKAMELGEKWDMKDAKMEAYYLLVDYSQRLGLSEQAEQYRNKFFRIKDTLLNYHQLASVQEMQFLGEMKHIDEQMEAMRRRGVVKNVVIVVVVCVALIIGVFLYLMRRKNKTLRENNRSLYQRNIEMLAAEEKERQLRHEKERLIEEMTAKTATEKYRNSTLDDATSGELLGRIRQVLEEEIEEICAPGFSLDRLAELTQASYKHVSQAINEQTGTNFNTLLNDYRIREACKRMNDFEQNGNPTIEVIANGVGFRSTNSFRAAFKRVTGLSPSEYLRQAKASQKG